MKENNCDIKKLTSYEMKSINGGVLPALAVFFLKGFAAGAGIGLALLPNIIEKRDGK